MLAFENAANMNPAYSGDYTDPSSQDQAEFALRLYFGDGDDKLELAIRRAHQDFSRTVHGIGKCPDARQKGAAFMHSAISELALQQDGNQVLFDTWHEKTAKKLCAIYMEAGYSTFYIGQAQKWMNMALKYVYVFGELRLPGYDKLFPYCHVPIDNIILEKDEFKELRSFNCAWSRISNYEEYMAFQLAVRQKFLGSSPLAVEFWAWQRNSAT
jgi:hypothetical protein